MTKNQFFENSEKKLLRGLVVGAPTHGRPAGDSSFHCELPAAQSCCGKLRAQFFRCRTVRHKKKMLVSVRSN